MSRVRFDILVQNTIRYLRYDGDQPASITQLGSSPPEQQSPELPRGDDQLVSMTQPASSLPEQQSPELSRGDDQLVSMTAPTSSPPEQQSPELSRGGDPHALMTKNLSEQRSRAAIKKSLRFLLRPLKPIVRPVARYVRRYFVGDIEVSTRVSQALLGHILSLAETLHARQASLEAHQASLEAHQASLEAHQASLEAHQASLEARQASLEAHQASLENRQTTLETRQATFQELVQELVQGLSHTLLAISGRLEHALELEQRALELGQLLHSKVDDLGLRSRGVVPIDVNTVVMRTYDGFVFVPRSDDLLLLMLLDAGPGGLEPGTRRILTKFLSPGMTFVDVGAHIGLLTLAGARAVGPTGKVLAIEPAPTAFEALRRTIAVSGLAGSVKAIRQAIGAHSERRTFYVRDVLGRSSLSPSGSDSEASIDEIEVELSPLDNLLQVGERVDLVKIDVEGAELAVLAGMTRIIAENPYLVIIAEFSHPHLRARQIAPQCWFASFRNQGFEPLVIDESSGKCRPVDLGELAKIESVNILFARKPATLSRALR
jgi:FkbM family methyltransferase